MDKPEHPYWVRPSHVAGTFDVIHKGPYVVSRSLREEEAIALMKALNQENRGR